MFIINCPYCGDRDQTEFSCHGEAHIARPTNTKDMTDEQWGDYVFFRTNPKGYHRERWVHDHGCRRWFNAVRHTVTDELIVTYKVDDPRPEIPDGLQASSGKPS